MSTLLLTPAYLPPIAWWQQALQAQEIVLDIHSHYQKQTYRNRCKILSANGILDLTIPVMHPVKNHILKDIHISYEENWQKQHWQAICSAYGKSPYFLYYRDSLEELYLHQQHSLLLNWNMALIEWAIQKLKVNIDLKKTETYWEADNTANFKRAQFHAKGNPLEAELTHTIKYLQVFADKLPFTPNLSILDLLCNEGPAARHHLLK